MGPRPFIIDDSNAHNVIRQITDPLEPFSGGYEPQLYDDGGLASVCDGEWNGTIIREREVDELIRYHEENQSSPDHWRLHKNVPVLDQNGLPYCWQYGVVGAMMVAYAQSGADVPHLSAAYPAAMGKNWIQRGGWGGEAITNIKRYGVPTVDVYPEHAFDRQLAATQAVKDSAAIHNDIRFLKLPQVNGYVPLEVLRSVVLDPENPMPFSCGFDYWGHLTYSTKWGRTPDGREGHKNVNSWKITWGQRGCSFLTGRKAIPVEAIAIQRGKPIP